MSDHFHTTKTVMPRLLVKWTPEKPKEVKVRPKKEKSEYKESVCISDEQVGELRWLSKFGGKSKEELAKFYNVSEYTVYSIIKGSSRRKVGLINEGSYPVGYDPMKGIE